MPSASATREPAAAVARVQDAGAGEGATVADVAAVGVGSDAGVVVDRGPAAIVSSFPADGALGVAADVELLIDFGRAMRTSSLPAAIETDDLPLTGASLVWSDGDRVLHITLAEPLELAAGDDPSTLAARCYSYRVSEAALDATGRAIQPSLIHFCTARAITQTLVPVLDPDSSGNFRSDGNYGDGTCARGGDTICVGDSGFAANSEYRGFLTFDSSALPASGEVSGAELRIDVGTVAGDPFADLGQLLVEQLSFIGPIGSAAFNDVTATSVGALTFPPGGGSVLVGDLALRGPLGARAQLRLRFSAGTDLDGISDHIQARPDTLALQVVYLIP